LKKKSLRLKKKKVADEVEKFEEEKRK